MAWLVVALRVLVEAADAAPVTLVTTTEPVIGGL
jgi:hypothetical protein